MPREINEWIAVGDWTLYVTFPQKVERVTPADVQRVAKQYLERGSEHHRMVRSDAAGRGEGILMRRDVLRGCGAGGVHRREFERRGANHGR